MNMKKIYTIGHSLTGTNKFLQKLRDYGIEILVDVRTIPYSSRAKQFNREFISKKLAEKNIEYLYRGKNLGGRGENIDFDATVDEIKTLASLRTTVLMCSEGVYKQCHRYTILTPLFEKKGLLVEHIEWKENKVKQQSLFA